MEETQEKKPRKKMPLAGQIFIALVLALIAGMLLQSHSDIAVSYIRPFGTIFLKSEGFTDTTSPVRVCKTFFWASPFR